MNETNNALVKAFECGYRVSKCGLILETPLKTIKLNFNQKSSYPTFYVIFLQKKSVITWHRLQAYQKYGEKMFEKGIVVRHKNSVKTDCSWDNILIGTVSENSMDRPEEERLLSAIRATKSSRKYDATEVKEFYNVCKSYKQTMEKFNISSKGTLHFILNNAKHS